MIVRVERLVAGGLGLARDPGGRVVLVRDGLPGDEVRVEAARERPGVVHADIAEVLSAGELRVEPPCPGVAAGCGGCDLQHAAVDRHTDLKREIVSDALRRIGKVAEPPVRPGPPVPPTRYRTTVRCLVRGDRAAYRARASHEAVPVAGCLVAHPLVEEVLVDGRFPGAREVVVRAGARTGERLVVVDPAAAAVVPADVQVVGVDELAGRRPRRAAFHEEVAGRRWRVSARSFFQPSPEGAEALVRVARELAGDALGRGPIVDLYGGVGLFAGTLGGAARAIDPGVPLIVVERSRSSAGDARHNLADLGATVRELAVERWRPEPAALVVADPARAGLGRAGVRAVAGTGTGRLVLVSCDPAALGRDAHLLAAEGFALTDAVVVDQFGMTSHVEVVSRFDR